MLIVNNSNSKDTIPRLLSIKLTWVGLFFNTVLPGAITGDIIKFYYIKKEKPNMKQSYLFNSVLLDRIIGLAGLLILSSIFCIINYNELVKKSIMIEQVLHLSFLLTAIAIIGFTILVFSQEHKKFFLDLTLKVPFFHNKLFHFCEQLFQISACKKTLVYSLIISIVAHTANVLGFWVLTSPFFENHISLINIFAFTPLGLLTTALPIAPAGMGVGHAAFSYLFSFLNNSNGASLFNLFFLATISNNLLGVIPYLGIKKKNK